MLLDTELGVGVGVRLGLHGALSLNRNRPFLPITGTIEQRSREKQSP